MKTHVILSTLLLLCACEKTVETKKTDLIDMDKKEKKLQTKNTETNEDKPQPASPKPTSPQQIPPNLLLIITDDQGVDASAQYPYSNDPPNTPTLNALAKAGVVFDNAWATPACTTTRGTIITGHHGINSGISYVPAVMSTKTLTLQRYLKTLPSKKIYQTAVIGKWHLGGHNAAASHPIESGVDYYAGNLSSGVEDYTNWAFTLNGDIKTSTAYHTSKITDLAIDWLAKQQEDKNPWFLWLAFAAPHAPFHLPPAHLHNRTSLTGDSQHIDKNKRSYYLAAVEAMDTEIGRLLDSLPQETRNNTLIIFLGDNGTPSGVIDTSVFIRKNGKGTLAEGGIRIPMFASGLGVTRKNERESGLINSTDIYATFLQTAGADITQIHDSVSFLDLLSNAKAQGRTYNYAEFESEEVTGWTVRNQAYKYIEYQDGTQALFNLDEGMRENKELTLSGTNSGIVQSLKQQGEIIRNKAQLESLNITDVTLEKRSANCQDYINDYHSEALDVNHQRLFKGDLSIRIVDDECVFTTNNIPNHHFNDGELPFPNQVSEQKNRFTITANPTHAESATPISIGKNNAILLNGVKVDLLAAACFGVGNGKIGCNNNDQPWRYDPMFEANGFRVDSHNAHSQPDGSYHYHGKPHALYEENTNTASPVVGFASDGYPVFGPYFDSGTIQKAASSYQLKKGTRPTGESNPGGNYDGTYRDDYEYVKGAGDLDECNGMMHNGVYGYYITDSFPYILACYKGTPSTKFR